VFLAHVTARGKASGVEVDLRLHYQFKVRDDKVVYLFEHEDRAEALEAAGLSESAMSQENVEIVRRGYEHFSRTGKLDPDGWDPDAVFDNSNAIFADPGVYRGRDGIEQFLVAQGDMWESQRYEPEEFIPVGTDRVVVPQKIVSVGRDGVEVVARTAPLFTLQGGKVIHMRNFQSEAEALEAAGLRE
jgi:ketosteroid isomerase-like protein